MIAEQFAGAVSKGNAAFALAIFFIKSAFSKGLISLAAAQQYVMDQD